MKTDIVVSQHTTLESDSCAHYSTRDRVSTADREESEVDEHDTMAMS